MRRETTLSQVEFIQKALEILKECSPDQLSEGEDRLAPGEVLVRKLASLLDERREMIARIERVEKEMAVFRSAKSETNRFGDVKKTKEYLENLVEGAGDAIFTLDRLHTIVSWNHGAEAIFLKDKQSVLGTSVYELVEETTAATLKDHISSVLNSGSIVTIEADAMRGNGHATRIALTLSPIRDAEGEVVGVSGIAKDITERKQVEEELRHLSEARSNFVSTVSHELRTPLTSIKSYVEILLHDMASLPEDTVKRYLSIMNDECDRLSGLISTVLDLQRLGSGRLEVRMKPLLLADLAGQAADLFEGAALPNRIELTREFNVRNDMTKVLGDRKRLMQVLSNLLSNAMKYTNVGGHVRIILDRIDEGVKLTVADDGIGIPEGDEEKVFEKFYRVDNPTTRSQGGTGLGLAIAKELVSLHGGRIWVESQEGKGSSFHVVLPAAE